MERGTRQGCPLSPLLFIMVLEILLVQVREDPEILGLRCKGFVFKYRAFADDIMFITENPTKTLPILIGKIKKFGDLAGFYLNKTKSKIMCKNVDKNQQKIIEELTNCEVVQKTKYLGVELTMRNIDLYKNNYEKLEKQVEKDLIKWNKLKLSLLGRISVIKMNVLPIILFFLQTIPIVKDLKMFGKWQKMLSEFVWAGKKPRIKMKVLCDGRDRGGFQLPNLRLYHDAVCLSWLREWITLENRKLLSLEGHNKIFGWHAYLMYRKIKMDGHFTHHFVRRSIYRVWERYKKQLGEKKPLWIVPAEVIKAASASKGEDWLRYMDLLVMKKEKGEMKSREDISYKYDWFSYRQIKE